MIRLQPNACVHNWLMRVNTQYDEATQKEIKAADYDRARESLGLESITNNYFLSPPQPAYSEVNIGNTTIIQPNLPPSSSFEDQIKKKKAEEEKSNWKGIAAIGIVSNAVAGISLFVYARLSKAAEGAINYLENTKRIKQWTEMPNINSSSDVRIGQINQIAHIQLKIDQRALDKITKYRRSTLASLVGTLAMASGGITILTSAPLFATTGIVTVIAGGVLNSIAAMYAAYNCGMHWSDDKEGKKELKELNIPSISSLANDLQSSNIQSQDHSSERPPSYNESQFIYNQRVNPNRIYSDLSGFRFAPSAPP